MIDIELNAGNITSKDLGNGGVDRKADKFSRISCALEHEFNMKKRDVGLQRKDIISV
ncbi:MAG: hypothetical protein HFI10_11280 [Lachnospiraceae bacterium]|nr:hypothetical protein [Lachnospiraceae bacterium]